MMQVLSQLLSAALGSVGFGLIFNLNRRYLPAAAVGGFLAWLAYLLADHALSSAFLANLLAGFCAALYAEILARCCIFSQKCAGIFVTLSKATAISEVTLLLPPMTAKIVFSGLEVRTANSFTLIPISFSFSERVIPG